MSIDFSQLAPPQMIEVLDYERILSERKQALIARFDPEEQDNIRAILSRESEPLTKFLEENAYRELILRHRINEAAKSCLLSFATGADLDHIAANFDTTRLVTHPATDTTPAVYESDEVFRSRVQRSFDRLSVAGPEAAYKYHSLSADGRVRDVSVISPSPAVVLVTILQSDSQTGEATNELVGIVEQALNAEHIRPIGDRVTVRSAIIVPYQIRAKIYVDNSPESATALAAATERITAYTKQAATIGRSVRLSALYASLHIGAVTRVEILSPTADIEISPAHASHCTLIDIQLGNGQ